MDVSKNRDFPPRSSIFNRVFYEKSPCILGGFPPVFGNTHIVMEQFHSFHVPSLALGPSRVEAVDNFSSFSSFSSHFSSHRIGQPVGNAANICMQIQCMYIIYTIIVRVMYIHVYTCISVLDFLYRLAFIYDEYMVYGCIWM